MKLDRRRLEAAHLKYAFLMTAKEYDGLFSLSDMVVYPNVSDTLQNITPKYYAAFQTRYFGGKHILKNLKPYYMCVFREEWYT